MVGNGRIVVALREAALELLELRAGQRPAARPTLWLRRYLLAGALLVLPDELEEVLGVDRRVRPGRRELRIVPRAAAERLGALLPAQVTAAEARVPELDDAALLVGQPLQVLRLHRGLQDRGEHAELTQRRRLVWRRERLESDVAVLRQHRQAAVAQRSDGLGPRSRGGSCQQQQVRSSLASGRLDHPVPSSAPTASADEAHPISRRADSRSVTRAATTASKVKRAWRVRFRPSANAPSLRTAGVSLWIGFSRRSRRDGCTRRRVETLPGPDHGAPKDASAQPYQGVARADPYFQRVTAPESIRGGIASPPTRPGTGQQANLEGRPSALDPTRYRDRHAVDSRHPHAQDRSVRHQPKTKRQTSDGVIQTSGGACRA